MGNSSQSNSIIKWLVIIADIVVLNIVLWCVMRWHPTALSWESGKQPVFWVVNVMALVLSEVRFSTIIHLRLISGGEILRRIVSLILTYAVLAYILLKVIDINMPMGHVIGLIATIMFGLLLLGRFFERWLVKMYRESGRNTRYVVLVGNDPELQRVYDKLMGDPTLGYRISGWYGDNKEGFELEGVKRQGTIEELIELLKTTGGRSQCDEMFVCLSRRDRERIMRLSRLCDRNVIRFYFVPVSVESLGINLKSELMDDMEVYTTYENPLQNPVNKMLKRVFDIVMSMVFLIPTAIIFPFVWLIIKIQSPGPIFFRQKRTGIDGKDFYMLKFRSMHVNADADKLQATKDDPRKYPFGNFMRKSNIDELPQFLNVLKRDMSIVGPRPHMLAHTEQYSRLIDKYMVRHFVKPGLTGWAQVTGFRGETKELWQMEGRVQRDIWYMEHWSIWLDIRIMWMTAKTIFIHDEHAY